MKDKSRNRTWGGVLTPCPIIILFQTAADSSDVITWQALQQHADAASEHPHEENDMFSPADSITYDCNPKMVSTSTAALRQCHWDSLGLFFPSRQADRARLGSRHRSRQHTFYFASVHLFDVFFLSYCVSLRLSVPALKLHPKNKSQPPRRVLQWKR